MRCWCGQWDLRKLLVPRLELVDGMWATGAHSSLNWILPRTTTRTGLFGGQFKWGSRAEAIYCKALVPFVTFFATVRPPL